MFFDYTWNMLFPAMKDIYIFFVISSRDFSDQGEEKRLSREL